MIRIRFILLVLLLPVILLGQSNNPKQSIIIKLKSGVSENETLDIIRSYPNTNLLQLIDNSKNVSSDAILSSDQKATLNNLSKYKIIEFGYDISYSEFENNLKSSNLIDQVIPNYIYKIDASDIPNDPRYKEQWGLKAVIAEKAWEKSTGNGILVGVLDTGIDFEHPDLKNQLWINPKEDLNGNGKFDPWPYNYEKDGIKGDFNGIDDDGNGYIDDIIGYDFVDQLIMNIGDATNEDPIPEDEHGHGTNISGVIAAERDNEIGITGLAFNSRIVTLKALDATGNGESDDIARAIIYAALNKVNILNFSFGEKYDSPLIRDAIKFANSMGCVIFGSSGNENSPARHYPSDYEEVISVGASNESNKRDYRSNYNSNLTLLAPGVSILTTNQNGTYKFTSGTSLSAPHASATAALLLESNPGLSPREIEGILMESANDIEEKGWDVKTGSGILNAEKAINNIGSSVYEITYPVNEQVIDRNKTNELNIKGSVLSPLLDTYSLSYGAGFNPQEWIPINENSIQIKNSTIGVLQLSNLEDTTYTLRIRANLRNGRIIEKRLNFSISSSNSKINIVELNISSPWFENKRVLNIDAKTNFKSKFIVEISTLIDSIYIVVQENRYESQFHHILVSDLNPNVEYELKISAYRASIDTNILYRTFVLSDERMPIDRFIEKKYSLPPSYLLNNVADIYSDEGQNIVVNDFTYSYWGAAKTYRFSNNQFELKDSTYDIKIPSGLGDSNNDGIDEILSFVSGKTYLTQSGEKGKSPFDRLLFSDTLTSNIWGTDLYDFTGDGIPEIVTYTDTSFIIYTYQNSKYLPAGTATNEELRFRFIGTFPGYTAGDFDGDGKQELCHGNNAGDIFIFKYDNGNFRRIFIDSTGNTDGNQYMYNVDTENDGIPEILIMNETSNVFIENNTGGNSLWNLRLLKNTGSNNFEIIWEDHFYGVRSGIGYRNGISAGDIDGIPGDEIFVSTFPNSYIFKWNKQKGGFDPMWWWPLSFTNTAIIHDFDKNGINEIGFNAGNQTRFFEYNMDFSGPKLPAKFDGWAVDETKAYLTWSISSNAQKYEIYKLILGNQAEKVAETNETEIIIDNLTPNKYYSFLIRSYNENLQDQYSDWSDLVEVFTHSPASLINYSIINKNQIVLKYSGKLNSNFIKKSNIIINSIDDNSYYMPATIVSAKDSSILLSFENNIVQGRYNIISQSFPDFYRTPTVSGEMSVDIEFPQKTNEIYLTKLNLLDKEKIELFFSENVRNSTSLEPNNYKINPYGKILDINYSNDNNAVIITIDKSLNIGPLGKDYSITALSNIESDNGYPMTSGIGNTLGFVFTSDNVNESFVYPNPVKISDGRDVYFAGLPQKAEIEIYSLNGKLIRVLFEDDGNGGVLWDKKDYTGNIPGTGVYLFKVIEIKKDGSRLESDMKKFSFIR